MGKIETHFVDNAKWSILKLENTPSVQWMAGQTYLAVLTPAESNAFTAFLRGTELWGKHIRLHAGITALEQFLAGNYTTDNTAHYERLQAMHLDEDIKLAAMAAAWCSDELVAMRAGKHKCPECGDEIFGPEEFEYPDGRVFCQECRDKVEKAEEVAAQAALEDWNAKHPIGTVVEWDGLSQCATDGPAFLMGGSNSLMVNLEGIGTVVVDKCRVMTSDECEAREARLLKHAKAIEREKKEKEGADDHQVKADEFNAKFEIGTPVRYRIHDSSILGESVTVIPAFVVDVALVNVEGRGDPVPLSDIVVAGADLPGMNL